MYMKSRLISKGFSLFELVAVLGVMIVLMLVAGPDLKGLLEESRTNAVAMELYADFQLAKSEAVKRQDDVVMIFRAASNEYDILFDSGSDWSPGDTLSGGDFYVKQNVQLPEDYTFAAGSYGVYGVDNEGLGLGVTFRDNLVYFQPTGRISDAHADTMDTLIKQNNRSVYITRKGDSRQDIYNHLRGIVLHGISGQAQVWRYRGAWVTHD